MNRRISNKAATVSRCGDDPRPSKPPFAPCSPPLRESPGPIPPTIAATLGLLVQLPVVYFITVQLLPVLETRLLARVARLPPHGNPLGNVRHSPLSPR